MATFWTFPETWTIYMFWSLQLQINEHSHKVCDWFNWNSCYKQGSISTMASEEPSKVERVINIES